MSGFGFNIRGGVDHPHVGSDPGIFITTVKADSVAGRDGRLDPGDRILAVSNHLFYNFKSVVVIVTINDLMDAHSQINASCMFHPSTTMLSLYWIPRAPINISSGCKESQFYSLPFGQAVVSMY